MGRWGPDGVWRGFLEAEAGVQGQRVDGAGGRALLATLSSWGLSGPFQSPCGPVEQRDETPAERWAGQRVRGRWTDVGRWKRRPGCRGNPAAPAPPLVLGGLCPRSLGRCWPRPWGGAGPGAGRRAGSSAVRGCGGGGVGGGCDGDMESGAYGAAKAGGSFDLRRFLTQPQVVVRAVCLVSRGAGPRGTDFVARPGEWGRWEPESATGGGGRGPGVGAARVGRASGARDPPAPHPPGPAAPRTRVPPPLTSQPGRGLAGRHRGEQARRPAGSGRSLRRLQDRWPARRDSHPGGIHQEGAFRSHVGCVGLGGSLAP